ncbi:hypothetical protein Cch01nite_40560 [Cellulomonas chitinilytica]|uniref:Uncharacterized protein n=1 Tax=Cellulomonas chitinilytica TaxID=398759 RepID=A0A919U4D3_9CELL|nr:hypothetical protein [Cellulomonas chitinilytica]GIG23332.1 hypothetical protein Cch01nite_40560 [Cellulomonas chitinilytica]
MADSVAVGAWWDPATWDAARSAYVCDLDHEPGAPAGFVHWLAWVLEAHVARGPAGRADLGVRAAPRLGRAEGKNRKHELPPATLHAVDEAIVEDRAAGRLLSRSAWIHEAVVVAVTNAERRAGGQLAPVVGRLPNRPSKAIEL